MMPFTGYAQRTRLSRRPGCHDAIERAWRNRGREIVVVVTRAAWPIDREMPASISIFLLTEAARLR